MAHPSHVRIVEVGARDGLQNEKGTVSVETKVAFINLLSASGLRTIEAGAFVSPKWVPQMADTDKVFAAIDKKPGVSYPVLVPNEKGMEAAVAAGAGEIAVFAAASETFSKKNINCTIDESLARFAPVMRMAQERGIRVRGYVSCVLGCPYEGDIAPQAVARVSVALRDMGCYEISLGDTIGVGRPETTHDLLRIVTRDIAVENLAVHFHDTYARAIENIQVALGHGVAVIDSSTSGLGGCPYAPGAAGNVATEKVLALLGSMNIETGVDPAAIEKAGRFIRAALAETAPA
jgi:hydroxymethylglutaryl-CoA lyase